MTKTSCDWIVERLPWWVNETLEGGERERVSAHLDECAACRAELAATRQAMALYAAHLPVEALLALAEGGAGAAGDAELGGVSRAAADAHLGHCAECREELALLRASRAAVAADADEGATVTAFAPRRAAGGPGAGGRWRFDRRAVALAASVLVAVVAAGGWLTTGRVADERGERLAALRQQVEAMKAAQPGPASGSASSPAGDRASTDAEEAAAARQEERIRQLEDEVERLETDLMAAQQAAPTGRWTAGPAAHVRVDVLRGAGEQPADTVDTVDAGTADSFSYFVTGAGDRPLRLVVADDSTGRTLSTSPTATEYASEELGRHVILTLPLAGLPEGTLRVRVLSGDEELASRLLRVRR